MTVGESSSPKFLVGRSAQSSIVHSSGIHSEEHRDLTVGRKADEPNGAGGRSRMGKTYRHPAMKQLKDQQTRYAPRERRLEQVERAEQLLGEIEGPKRYPYEYLCFRITGFRPDGWPALVLDGSDVQHDLRLFVEDL